MAVIDAEGRELGLVRPPGHLPLPSGDFRRAELAFPFDMAWVGTSGNVYRSERLRRIMPIPAEEYGRWGADWYLVHLSALLGPVVALDEIGGLYRVHGRNAFEPATPVLDLARVRREIDYQQITASALSRLADELGLEHRGDPVAVQCVPAGHFPQARSRRPPGGRGPGRPLDLEGGPGRRASP